MVNPRRRLRLHCAICVRRLLPDGPAALMGARVKAAPARRLAPVARSGPARPRIAREAAAKGLPSVRRAVANADLAARKHRVNWSYPKSVS